MNAAISAIPVVQDLSRLLTVLLVMNAVLTGLVILFAYRASLYHDRLKEMEEAGGPAPLPPAPADSPLSDDKPIPPVRDPRRAIWRPPTTRN